MSFYAFGCRWQCWEVQCGSRLVTNSNITLDIQVGSGRELSDMVPGVLGLVTVERARATSHFGPKLMRGVSGCGWVLGVTEMAMPPRRESHV
jgi:hypothetical protein